MSYCRWSSDDYNCDLYCYADVRGGWTTHVAGNRAVGVVPSVSGWLDKPFDADKAAALFKAQHEFLEDCERVTITLPHAGETFNDPTLEAFRDRLLTLRRIGYNFPDYVLEEVEAEIAADANA